MKKFFIFFAACLPALFSCSKEFAPESASDMKICKEGISFIASADITKVTVDTANAQSQMNWEAGDRIKVWYDGNVYNFVTTESGRTVTFYAETAADVISSLNTDKPLAAYYNVTSVASDGKASFSVSATQTEGTASNKTVLYSYLYSTEPQSGVQSLTFTPLVSVLELNIRATSLLYDGAAYKNAPDDVDYSLTRLVLTPKDGITGYTCFTSATVDPESGTVTPTGTSAEALTYNFADTTNIKDGRSIQLIVGEFKMDNTGATMDWYKGDVLNYTRDLWTAKTIDFTSGKVHFYQPVKAKEFGFGDYTSYYNRFYGCRGDQSKFINYCDDGRNLVLTADIQMVGANGNRICTFNNLEWPFDGRNHCLFDVEVTDESSSRNFALFTNLKADVRNLTFGKKGRDKNNVTLSYSAAATVAPIASIAGGATVKIENFKNYVNFNVTQSSASVAAYTSGLVGTVSTGAVVTLENCENYGSITSTVTAQNNKYYYVSGFVGTANNGLTIRNCRNYGDITLEGPLSAYGVAAGILAYSNVSSKTVVDGCENYGKIYNHNTYPTSEQGKITLFSGGICGRMNKHNNGIVSEVTNCTNYGFVSVVSDQIQLTSSAATSVKAGGIIADLQTNIASNNSCRADVEALSGDGKGLACWYTSWVGDLNVFGGGSVLAGIKVNGVEVTASNYTNKNFATSAAPSGVKDKLTLLSE